MENVGLVLEGGGMKGVYTSGVLDYFIEKDLYFQRCYGVSAGACNLCSYISKQKKRAYRVTVDYLDDKNYCSLYSLFTTGDLFNVDMCYNKIPNELDFYDYKEAARYEGDAYAVVTNIRTGKPEYMPLRELHRDIIAVRASASLPLLSRNVKIGTEYYLDGGISDAVPIRRAVADGIAAISADNSALKHAESNAHYHANCISDRAEENSLYNNAQNKVKNIVVLTKEEGYIRKPASKINLALLRLRYGKYPQIYKLMANRHARYNETLHFLEQERQAGRAFVIRPKEDNEIARIEKDHKKLEAFYRQGYEDAKKCFPNLMDFLHR